MDSYQARGRSLPRSSRWGVPRAEWPKVVVGLASGVAATRALIAWLTVRADLDPDTSLYAQGGLGVFPSPLGRFIGLGGPWAIALVNIAANALLVLAVAAFAERIGGRGWAAALLVVVAPLSLWTIFAAMDTVAAALFMSGLAWGRRRTFFSLAVGLHLAALLVVVAYAFGRRPWLALAALAAGGIVVLSTPYRGILLDLDPVTVATSAVATAGIFLFTFLPFTLRLWEVRWVLIGGVLAAGLVSTSTWETNMRYTLPAVGLAAALATRRAS